MISPVFFELQLQPQVVLTVSMVAIWLKSMDTCSM